MPYTEFDLSGRDTSTGRKHLGGILSPLCDFCPRATRLAETPRFPVAWEALSPPEARLLVISEIAFPAAIISCSLVSGDRRASKTTAWPTSGQVP